MGFLKKTSINFAVANLIDGKHTAAKRILSSSSLVLSLSFHALILAFFIISHFNTEVTQQKEFSVMEARLVEYAKPIKKEIPVSSEKNSRTLLSEAKPEEKPVAVFRKKTLSVSMPTPPAVHINKESLQNDIRYVAENAVFGKTNALQFFDSETKFSSYRLYVDACREKLVRVGNASNKADKDGTITLHVTIGKNGEVIERHAGLSDSSDLARAAFDVVDAIHSFGMFPKDLPLQTIKISLNLHFVTR